MTYIQKALFIYDDEESAYLCLIKDNSYGCVCKNVDINTFLNNPTSFKTDAQHILLSCTNENIHKVLQEAVKHEYSIGFLPLSKDKDLIRAYSLSSILSENLEIALRDELELIDLIECENEFYHLKIRLGDIPLIQSMHKEDSFFIKTKKAFGQFLSLKLFNYDFETSNKEIKTAASGLMIANHAHGSSIVNALFKDTSMREGKMSMILVSPSSILQYIYFLSSIFHFSSESKKLPESVSFLKSEKFNILSADIPVRLDNLIDKSSPICFELKKEAVKINASTEFWEKNPKRSNEKEVSKISALPDEKERVKYTKAHLPFFAVASAERFKELFLILRDDAKINSQYLMLMFLSTILATIGLFANSAAVVIGAMVLAPLMTPIVAFAMGTLRGEEEMLRYALYKIALGVFVALSASALMSMLLPQIELTSELKARINPTLLDLGVAIFSGIAAAYTKSHKSIRDSLAGVAIAVALVPPLATAGIGLGRGEFYVFYGAFLLFFTNLIGISLAATITFQFLGFSNAVKSKKSLIAVSLLLAIITYPLYLSYHDIIDKYELNLILKQNRYLVDDKYIIIKNANLVHKGDIDVIHLKLLLRDALNRDELEQLKQKIQLGSKRKIYLHIETEYIL